MEQLALELHSAKKKEKKCTTADADVQMQLELLNPSGHRK